MTTQPNPKDAYAQAGVDIDAGNALVQRIKPLARATARHGTTAALGGFGAFFDLKATGYKDPLLVSSNDGVGTKLKIAIETGLHHGIGIDCVAMCVNDVVVSGAEPLFFLDYYATGKLDVAVAEQVIASVAKGCQQAGCALVGGETAELPGLYAAGDYDVAGFTVGAVERGQVITGETIAAGDVVLGVASSGLHSNGFSLVRNIVKTSGFDYQAPAPFAPQQSLGAALLTPTLIYVKPLLALTKAVTVKGMAHITGGGLLENVPRVLPAGLGVDMDVTTWPLPPVFAWLAKQAYLAAADMLRTFNCGIGMVVVVAPEQAAAASAHLTASGLKHWQIGGVAKRVGSEEVMQFKGISPAWLG